MLGCAVNALVAHNFLGGGGNSGLVGDKLLFM